MNLKDALSVLIVGSSQRDYPFYAPYVYSDGVSLCTCNESSSVKLNYEAPFTGAVNIFVLNNILKAIGDEEYYINQKDKESLVIESGKSVLALSVFDIKVPDIKLDINSFNLFPITDDLENCFNMASLFVGQDALAPVYVDSKRICATTRSELFYSPQKLSVAQLGLTKDNIKIIKSGYDFTSDQGNFVLVFDSGYIVMTTHLVDTYPFQKIESFITDIDNGKEKVCNFAVFEEAAKYLSSIFTNTDKEKKINIHCKDEVLTLSAKSVFSGKSIYSYNIDCPLNFSVDISLSALKKLNFSYDLYYNKKNKGVMIFNNEVSTIVLQGEVS